MEFTFTKRIFAVIIFMFSAILFLIAICSVENLFKGHGGSSDSKNSSGNSTAKIDTAVDIYDGGGGSPLMKRLEEDARLKRAADIIDNIVADADDNESWNESFDNDYLNNLTVYNPDYYHLNRIAEVEQDEQSDDLPVDENGYVDLSSVAIAFGRGDSSDNNDKKNDAAVAATTIIADVKDKDKDKDDKITAPSSRYNFLYPNLNAMIQQQHEQEQREIEAMNIVPSAPSLSMFSLDKITPPPTPEKTSASAVVELMEDDEPTRTDGNVIVVNANDSDTTTVNVITPPKPQEAEAPPSSFLRRLRNRSPSLAAAASVPYPSPFSSTPPSAPPAAVRPLKKTSLARRRPQRE